MQKRFVSIWFRHLLADWFALRRPELKTVPFVVAEPSGGRIMVVAVNQLAEKYGIAVGMAAADAKAIVPSLKVIDHIPGQNSKLLKALGEWCIRYTPLITINLPDGLLLDVSGCAHLWGGERAYLGHIIKVLRNKGYDARGAMADTVGTAWAVARFAKKDPIIESGKQAEALLNLPPTALRLDEVITERLTKLGFYSIQGFMGIGRSVLRRRFGPQLMLRLDQALGNEEEYLEPLESIMPYHERLPCLEPIRTATGIEIAIRELLEAICQRLKKDGMGLRTAVLKCYRVDGQVLEVIIGTGLASHFTNHLFKLFELKIPTIEPRLAIELFTLDAPKFEEAQPEQEALWGGDECSLEDHRLAELLDKLSNKVGANSIRRYLPQEHHWPERSVKIALSLKEKSTIAWRKAQPRPSLMLLRPEPIEVMVKTPDYPPKFFIYKGEKHDVAKVDGPERIEREWWIEDGDLRDYYYVEDSKGRRYWLFRSGHYDSDQNRQWFLHGFFA